MNPKEISVAPPASPAETVDQKKVMVTRREKNGALRKIMRGEDINNAIIFCNRKRDVDVLLKSLVGHGFNAAALHGDMVQFKRMETLDRFKKGEVTILVASDVAARGLDIVTVSHVFNYDVPMHADDYVHRIGRTGRAGRSGKSYTFVTSDDDKYLAGIEKLISREIPVLDMGAAAPEPVPEAEAAAEEKPARQRRSRSRREKPADKPSEASVETADAKIAEDAPPAAEPETAPEQKAKAPRAPRAPRRSKADAKKVDTAAADAATKEDVEAQPYDIGAPKQQQPTRREPGRGRNRRDDISNLPGPSAFTDDDTPAFLLRPARKSAAG